MANFNAVDNLVAAVLQSVTASRSNQAMWYWRESVRRAMVDFRETGTPAVYPLTAGSASTYVAISAAASRVFGVLVENTHSGALAWGLYNSATPTPGTAPLIGSLVPATTTHAYTFNNPFVFSTAVSFAVTTALEGATQTNGTLLKLSAIYTT